LGRGRPAYLSYFRGFRNFSEFPFSGRLSSVGGSSWRGGWITNEKKKKELAGRIRREKGGEESRSLRRRDMCDRILKLLT